MNFTEWQEFYEFGWATKSQLQEAVQVGQLTKEQYKEITGDTYPEATAPVPKEEEPKTTAPAPTEEPKTTTETDTHTQVTDDSKKEKVEQGVG